MKTADMFGQRRGSPSLPLIWTLSTLLHIALLWGLSTMNLARGTGAVKGEVQRSQRWRMPSPSFSCDPLYMTAS